MNARLNGLSQPSAPPEQQRAPLLLATKLHIPQPCRDLVPRVHLYSQLNAAVLGRLTLICAPAGSGKTTLLAGWLGQRGMRVEDVHSQFHSAWVTLDAGDNDPLRFWRYLLSACHAFSDGIGEAGLAHLDSMHPPCWELVLTTLINDLSRCAGAVLVLDDYHFITAPQIHQSLAFLLAHAPPTLHVIMLTRSEPPLPLARLRAGAELSELRAGDLRFSAAETHAFFRTAVGRPLAPELIDRLYAECDGWVTGLRLVALALQRTPDNETQPLHTLARAATAGQRQALGYLVAEVLDAQPPARQDFLLRTSALSRLNAHLCDAVTGADDSDVVLAALAAENMFLLPVDAAGQWYTYHRLFARALQHEARQRLGEHQMCSIAQVASRWFEQHNLLADAIEMALATQELPRVAELIERSFQPQLAQNEYHTLRRWLSCLPATTLERYPALCLIDAVTLLFTADRRDMTARSRLDTLLAHAEQRWRAAGQPHNVGAVLAVRALTLYRHAERRAAFVAAREALTLLPAEATQWRQMCLDVAAMQALFTGELHAARQAAGESYALWSAAANVHAALAAAIALGDICARQGELRQAAQWYRTVLAEAERAPMSRNQAQQRVAGALLGLAELAYEWDDLPQAAHFAAQASAAGQNAAYAEATVRGAILLARTRLAEGNTQAAYELINAQAAAAIELGSPVLAELRAAQAYLALASGDHPAAERCLHALQQDDVRSRLQVERAALLHARLRLAQGAIDEALELLEPWWLEAQENGRGRTLMEITVLRCVAHSARHEVAAAKQLLRETLPGAHLEGYRRVLIDEGAAMAGLLRALWPDVRTEPLLSYVRSLLRGFAPGAPVEAACAITSLVEPLSRQERRVLALLVASRSNAEIAAELVVSINTVKTQIQSIFRKLDVNSRRAAADLARRLSLC